jgi:hypothetical protein
MSDACMVAGFVLALVGIYLLTSAGATCVVAGGVLFLAGGLDRMKR